MNKVRSVIIDDEPIAVDYLKQYIEMLPQLELVATFNRAKDAFELISNNSVDLVFLDIQMPEITGLDFIKTLPTKPHIILTTAYSEYALEGFELNVTDYLLKPISFDRFSQAVLKVSQSKVGEVKQEPVKTKDFIFLKSGYKAVKINISDIAYVEGSKEYVTYYTLDKRKYMKNERLKNVEVQFASFDFVRVHKSFLVNLKHVDTFYGNIIEILDSQIPIGRAYKDDLKKWIE